MAKRFTDSEKWKDDWYISLSNDYKIVWQWLLDNCNHSGLCKKSISLLNIMCKTNLKEEDIIEFTNDRIVIVGDYWFIPKFLKFQYSTLLSGKPAIVSVVRDIFTHNLQIMIPKSFGKDYLIINESFNNHCQMIKDMVKDKVKDKDMDMVKGIIKNQNSKKPKSVKFDEEIENVIFDDGSSQKLGLDQKVLAKSGNLKATSIIFGSIY